jgi:CheY-like chemotaxis protein
MLAKSNLDATQAKWVSLLEQSSKNLLSIVNDVLDLTKIEAGELSIHKHVIALHGWVEQVCAPDRLRAETKGLHFQLSVQDPIPSHICADAQRIQQVVLNLLGNAIKFTAEGRVSVRFSASTSESTDSCMLKFEIEDTGIGISKEQLASIFQPFKQADEAISRKFGGTGLGLAICAQLARAMSGNLRVQSQIGKGTKFTFSLPVALAQPSEESAAMAVAGGPKLALPRLHVLIAEDHPVNQLISQRALSLIGCTSELACDGLQALEMLRSKQFDLALIDIQMPNMDGLELARAWRKHEKENSLDVRLPIIAVTANAFESDRNECVRAGMDGYLSKPFQVEELEQTLSRFTQQSI